MCKFIMFHWFLPKYSLLGAKDAITFIPHKIKGKASRFVLELIPAFAARSGGYCYSP